MENPKDVLALFHEHSVKKKLSIFGQVSSGVSTPDGFKLSTLDCLTSVEQAGRLLQDSLAILDSLELVEINAMLFLYMYSPDQSALGTLSSRVKTFQSSVQDDSQLKILIDSLEKINMIGRQAGLSPGLVSAGDFHAIERHSREWRNVVNSAQLFMQFTVFRHETPDSVLWGLFEHVMTDPGLLPIAEYFFILLYLTNLVHGEYIGQRNHELITNPNKSDDHLIRELARNDMNYDRLSRLASYNYDLTGRYLIGQTDIKIVIDGFNQMLSPLTLKVPFLDERVSQLGAYFFVMYPSFDFFNQNVVQISKHLGKMGPESLELVVDQYLPWKVFQDLAALEQYKSTFERVGVKVDLQRIESAKRSLQSMGLPLPERSLVSDLDGDHCVLLNLRDYFEKLVNEPIKLMYLLERLREAESL